MSPALHLSVALPELTLAAGAMVLLMRRRLHPQGAGRTASCGLAVLALRARRSLRAAESGTTTPVRRQLHRRSLRPRLEAADAHRLRGHADHVDRLLAGEGRLKFEFPVLVLLATTGMLMMISANDLIALYVGLELQSLSLYVVAAFDRALGALERGRPQIFRPRRALVRHAALRRLADLRLHRLDRCSPTSPPRCSRRAPISASSSASSS
mgnify:CR=1 FL=1